MRILGQRVLRREDPRLLTTGGTYVADVRDPLLDDCVHLCFVRSTHAHAELVDVDVSAALARPGVRAVFTAADLDVGDMPPVLPRFDAALSARLLARARVRYVGEPVAVVAADTFAAAVDAAEYVTVLCEPFDRDALLFPERGSNLAASYEVGDPLDGLFAGCDVVVHTELVHQRMAACPLEARSAASVWDDAGRLHHWVSVQAPHAVKVGLQAIFGLDATMVRVIAPDVGGGFGPKFSNYPEDVVTAWVARRLRRPARWSETRTESMMAMHHGRGQRHRVTLGGTRDGRLLAYHLDIEQDAGAYASLGAYAPEATVRMTTGVYAIARARATARATFSATTPVSAYRGSGRPEATGAIERAVDVFARTIGVDPVELRRRNLIARDAFPYTTAVGTVYDTGDYQRAVDEMVRVARYGELRREQQRRRDAGERRRLGIGVAVYVESTAAGPAMEFGTVTVHGDRRRVVVRSGSSPHGQGHVTTWSMIASELLGIAIDDIEVVSGDTDQVPMGLGTYASRSVQLAGSAVKQACDAVVNQAKPLAAALLEADAADVVLDTTRGVFHVVGTPARVVDWWTVAREGSDLALSETTMFTGAMTFPFGAHLAVVEIDDETGESRVVQLVAVDDAGTIVNPVIADGQLHGGLAQGLAEALYEGVVFDGDGQPLTTNFTDYGIVSAAELPSFTLHSIETPTPLNPLGAKGIGESGTVGAVAAVRNAVCDALGAEIDTPLTPERVWRALSGRSERHQ
ncbi:MAG: xanthine dehydrogenase family protein molybdopterin-binding subunit [Actinobacteria bacterium]|nr:MAG: xanthine dehydrogenase family protein molybdopterin-binding subunit [Actinomycetota bacterium]